MFVLVGDDVCVPVDVDVSVGVCAAGEAGGCALDTGSGTRHSARCRRRPKRVAPKRTIEDVAVDVRVAVMVAVSDAVIVELRGI